MLGCVFLAISDDPGPASRASAAPLRGPTGVPYTRLVAVLSDHLMPIMRAPGASIMSISCSHVFLGWVMMHCRSLPLHLLPHAVSSNSSRLIHCFRGRDGRKGPVGDRIREDSVPQPQIGHGMMFYNFPCLLLVWNASEVCRVCQVLRSGLRTPTEGNQEPSGRGAVSVECRVAGGRSD